MNILRIVSNQIILNHFEQMQDTLRTSIEISKQNYYFKLSIKLAVNKINPKYYWFILKSFLYNKKIPRIPPLIHNNQLFVDFKKKRGLFNLFLTKQCTHIETRSNLPTQLLCNTNESLNTINFIEDDLLNVIRKLDPIKEHGHDKNQHSYGTNVWQSNLQTITFDFFFLYRVRNLPN